MAILIPVPFAPSVCWITSAPMIDGERSSAIVYCTLGYTCVTYDWRMSAGRRFGRQADRQPVEDDAEAAADVRVRDRAVERGDGARLRLVDPREVRARGGAVHLEPAARAGAEEPAAGRLGERRQPEVGDDADVSGGAVLRERDRPNANQRHRLVAEGAVHRHERG